MGITFSVKMYYVIIHCDEGMFKVEISSVETTPERQASIKGAINIEGSIDEFSCVYV